MRTGRLPRCPDMVRELVLGDEALTADAVHDLQTLAAREAAGGGVREEVEEARRLEPAPAVAASAPIVKLASRTQV